MGVVVGTDDGKCREDREDGHCNTVLSVIPTIPARAIATISCLCHRDNFPVTMTMSFFSL